LIDDGLAAFGEDSGRDLVDRQAVVLSDPNVNMNPGEV
jgi:hypothetical protein